MPVGNPTGSPRQGCRATNVPATAWSRLFDESGWPGSHLTRLCTPFHPLRRSFMFRRMVRSALTLTVITAVGAPAMAAGPHTTSGTSKAHHGTNTHGGSQAGTQTHHAHHSTEAERHHHHHHHHHRHHHHQSTQNGTGNSTNRLNKTPTPNSSGTTVNPVPKPIGSQPTTTATRKS